MPSTAHPNGDEKTALIPEPVRSKSIAVQTIYANPIRLHIKALHAHSWIVFRIRVAGSVDIAQNKQRLDALISRWPCHPRRRNAVFRGGNAGRYFPPLRRGPSRPFAPKCTPPRRNRRRDTYPRPDIRPARRRRCSGHRRWRRCRYARGGCPGWWPRRYPSRHMRPPTGPRWHILSLPRDRGSRSSSGCR